LQAHEHFRENLIEIFLVGLLVAKFLALIKERSLQEILLRLIKVLIISLTHYKLLQYFCLA